MRLFHGWVMGKKNRGAQGPPRRQQQGQPPARHTIASLYRNLLGARAEADGEFDFFVKNLINEISSRDAYIKKLEDEVLALQGRTGAAQGAASSPVPPQAGGRARKDQRNDNAKKVSDGAPGVRPPAA